MDIILGLILSTMIFVFSVLRGIDTIIPLFIVLCIFFCLSVKRGVSFKDSLSNLLSGGKKSIGVLKIFILIGAIVSLWMMSGTVPAIVYYGIDIIHPRLFILSAFLLSAVISMLIGTSFGAVGTVGISLMVMARAGDGNLFMVAGAILSGAYLGDRMSPMSSSANLVATITNTKLYDNIKLMMKTSVVPLVLSCILYLVLALANPVNYENSTISGELIAYFNITFIVLLPAFIIVILSLFKIEVKKSMAISMATAAIIAFLIQGETIIDIIKTAIFGFKLPIDNPLHTIIKGGGILSMVKLVLIVFMSSALTGIFEGANMLDFIEGSLEKIKNQPMLFLATIVTSIVSSMVGCTQVLAVMLTHMTMEKSYRRLGIDNPKLAIDLENTAIVIAPLIPWNVAVLVPLTTLGVSPAAIVFAFYLILLPIVNLIFVYFNNINKRQSLIE